MDLSDPDTAAMAAAMGFSSFGAQDGHPSKKRRYNPRADAASDSVAVPFAATGANDTPVAAPISRNADEIDLEDDDDIAAAAPPVDGPALAYTQTQIDEMITRSGSTEDTSQAASTAQVPTPDNGVSLPNRPNPAWGQQYGSQPTQGGRGGHGLGRRGGHSQPHRDEEGKGRPWWEGYYDPKSNMNPWSELEKSAALQPQESWELKGVAGG